MLKTQKISVTAFILNSENKVLIVKRSKTDSFLPGFFELPGGKVEFGESVEEALTREIKEETALRIKLIRPYSTFSYLSTDRQKQTIDIQCICKVLSKNYKVRLSEEHEDFNWIPLVNIKKFKFSAEMRKAIAKGFNDNAHLLNI